MPDWRPHQVMMPGRMAAILLLAMALLQPAPGSSGKANVAALVDHSGSMSLAAIEEARDRLASDLDPLDGKIDVNAMRFGATTFDNSLDDVLRAALRTMPANFGNGIVIASDGYWSPSVEPLLKRLAGADLPVYWLPAATARGEPRIVAIAAPSEVAAGEEVAVSVTTVLPDDTDYDVVLLGDRSPLARSRAGRDRAAVLRFAAPGSGVLALGAELVRNDDGASIARIDDLALVNIAAPPTLLLLAEGASPFGDSLAAGGWPLTRVSPTGFPALLNKIGRYDALVLDNIPANSLSEASWTALGNAVRGNATGLLVLGGPNSFALGAYRDSTLERLLPLISEPPESEQAASVQFLVDISGSMGSGDTNTLRIARAAVLETAAALRAVDRIGLAAFDIDARQLLPLASRDDHAEAIRAVWPVRASGGTSLVPALELALAALETESNEQKILMVVTDGMLTDEDIASLEQRLARTDVLFVAMVVDPNSAAERLTRIAASERATILLVDDVLRLPQLMRNELETRRQAIVQERTVPVLRSPVPFVEFDDDWPAFDAYLVTRPRPDATVLLGSANGDALLATWTAGAGRVVALTGGLGQWAGDWIDWERWPQFTASLASHIAVRSASQMRLHESSGKLELDIAASENVPGKALLIGPTGAETAVGTMLVAPRRYEITTPLSQPGPYSLIWEDDSNVNRYSFVNRVAEEPAAIEKPLAEELLDQGLLQQWTSADALMPRRSGKNSLLLLALVVFLLTITIERVPLQFQKRYRRARRARRPGAMKPIASS